MPSPTEKTHPRPVWRQMVTPELLGVAMPVPAAKMPSMGFFRLHDNRDGTLTPRAEIHDAWMRPGMVEHLPLGGLTVEVIRKLIAGGFVIACQPAPTLTLVNVTDLLRHCEEAEEPGFWTAARKRDYAEGVEEWRQHEVEARKILPADAGKVRAIGVMELRQAPGGLLRPCWRTQLSWMRVSEVADGPRRLPLGISADVLYRLICGQFVLGTKVAPASSMVDVWDLLRHYEETSGPAAQTYWTPERVERYRATERGGIEN